MASKTVTGFDSLAQLYDQLWSNAPAGTYQRRAVWRRMLPLFQPGASILDIGCGTGVDALSFMAEGVRVEAIDASSQMVRIASGRGVHARQLAVEDLSQLTGPFDGAISNFGVFNCVPDMQRASADLGDLIRPGGHLAICVMGAFCLWEVCHFLRSGRLKKAFRRLSRSASETSLGVEVRYPRVSQMRAAFQPHFRLLGWTGIGAFVPPSYVSGLPPAFLSRLAGWDTRIESRRVFRAMADHRLLVFTRI